MFTQLLFLILVLLLLGLAPEIEPTPLFSTTWEGYFLGGVLYLFLLFAIWRQKWSPKWGLFFVNLELLLFFVFFYFVLGAFPRFSMQTFGTVMTLGLYFLGLAVFHYTAASPLSRRENTKRQIKMYLPFTFPILVFTLIADLMTFLPTLPLSPLAEGILLLVGIAIFLAVVLIFFPPLTCFAWECAPLEDPVLENRLQALCERARFRHAGFREWKVMNHAYTAAILGVVARFRYILFTKNLLENLSPIAIEAILAHEIGHSKHKHLLLYPFILFGMLVTSGLLTNLVGVNYPPALVFAGYAGLFALYFRFVFGFFSRLFERQADLHVLKVGLPVEAMIEALHDVGVLTGHTHHEPNWHHHSLQERIAFLERVASAPKQATLHHRKVKIALILYFILLLCSLIMLQHA